MKDNSTKTPQYAYAVNINKPGFPKADLTGIVDVKSKKILCLCNEKKSKIILSALEKLPPLREVVSAEEVKFLAEVLWSKFGSSLSSSYSEATFFAEIIPILQGYKICEEKFRQALPHTTAQEHEAVKILKTLVELKAIREELDAVEPKDQDQPFVLRYGEYVVKKKLAWKAANQFINSL